MRRCAFLLALVVTSAFAADNRTPVLLELFTSEGCSDCPPADRLLDALDQKQPIPGAELIVLSEHVDYWNRLGWQDPWSSAANSARQQEYGRRFGLTDIYTPQLVIDGAAQMVGSDGARIDRELEKATHRRKIPVTLSYGSGSIHVETGPGSGRVYAAVAQNRVTSQVARGENAGRALTHVAVLRTFVAVGDLNADRGLRADLALAATAGQRVIVFIQDPQSGRILGAAQQRISD